MEKSEKEIVRKHIHSEIAKTKEIVLEYKEATKPIAPENAIGRISRMDAINNKSVTEAALRSAEEKLRSLILLEKKVDDPGFGLCNRCKNQIPLPRLLFRPQSSFCVHCAS